MELRPHQVRAIDLIRQSIRKGNKRIMLGANTSFGKTITAGYILNEARKKGKHGIFFCDRIKLVNQSLQAFDGLGLDVGVIQGMHERTDYSKPIQIASIQTVARKRRKPEFDIAIVDEAHMAYKSIRELMDRYSNIVWIGLSATPYTKSLGKIYQDLIVPITPRELIDQGYLCPVDYYGGESLDTAGLKTKRTSIGTYDYDPMQLQEETEKQQDRLSGDIVKNWLKYGKGRQTIAFSPSIKHSKYLVDLFNQHGIPAEHIDGYMQPEDREDLFQAHNNGEFMILSCSQLLTTGYDSPTTSCIIDCKPTKSLTIYCQTVGRIMRTAKDKHNAIYLDHAGNVRRHGFAEDIVPDELDDGEKKFNERNQTKEKKEPKVRQCPQCFGEMVGIRCKCGYEIPIKEQIDTDDAILQKLSKTNKEMPYTEKQRWYGELLHYASLKGKKKGWVAHTYKKKFGVFPNKVEPTRSSDGISQDVSGHIKHCNIAFIKGAKSNA